MKSLLIICDYAHKYIVILLPNLMDGFRTNLRIDLGLCKDFRAPCI